MQISLIDRAQKFLIHENTQDVQNFVPLSKANIEDRGELNAIYKPRLHAGLHAIS